MKRYLLFVLFLLLFNASARCQSLYFPPLTGSSWDTVSPASLGWCTTYLDTLHDLLQQTNTKAFILLKDGKIAWEKYFGTFTADSTWYWASAGKSATAFAIGQAQELGYLSINDQTSQYLGTGWTSEPSSKEALITIRHQLTMTTGLDDGVADPDCLIDTCLDYKADAGTRWAYHNAPYRLLHVVVDSAAGSFNQFFNNRLMSHTGMNGFWYQHVFFSKPRSMARFGLLMLNRGIWNTDTLMHDTAYFNSMINTSQSYNNSYGYLWWLNGKSSFMVPGSQLVLNGPLIPNAPPDMYAALGKNDQKIHVVPSKGLVLVRMGNAAYGPQDVPMTVDDEIWKVLNKLFCTTSIPEDRSAGSFDVFPNPFGNSLQLEVPDGDPCTVSIYNTIGENVYHAELFGKAAVDMSGFAPGIYTIRVLNKNNSTASTRKIIKIN